MTMPVMLWRMAWIFKDFRRRSDRVRSLPIRLWIETASVCNLRCVMCPNKDYPATRKGVMGLDLFKKIVDEARHFANDIYLHHRGEPLLNPALFDMIRYARAAGLKTRFHTNGALLNEEKARRLLEAGPDLVSFSVDGFTRDSYERIRGGAVFKQTVDNILNLAALRREMKRKKPYIVIEKIRFRSWADSRDAAAVAALRRRFLDAGVDEIIEKEEYIWAGPDAPQPEGIRSGSPCTFPWYAMVICHDGTVTPCPQDFHAHMALGNVRDSTLHEIWNGAPYRDLRRRLAADIEALPLCRKCDRLYRKTVGGIPLQYMLTFLVDHLVGYGGFRKWLGTHERN
ncbi:MAG: radical SAM protein [Verrucomicrobia bacterium]|nr:radical SAM protein [Verrucomicrobiota bacterium]MBU4291906.1 radical SAM protein [Verrucomicrobiota bacterium]MBU4497108.1 radical SAM protein [Verrucomicrobiota bacterium]MCG2679531.1 radical SAM protein [Kiritimatiellia bacterium]